MLVPNIGLKPDARGPFFETLARDGCRPDLTRICARKAASRFADLRAR